MEPGTHLRAGSWAVNTGGGTSLHPLSPLGMIRPHPKTKALLDKHMVSTVSVESSKVPSAFGKVLGKQAPSRQEHSHPALCLCCFSAGLRKISLCKSARKPCRLPDSGSRRDVLPVRAPSGSMASAILCSPGCSHCDYIPVCCHLSSPSFLPDLSSPGMGCLEQELRGGVVQLTFPWPC